MAGGWRPSWRGRRRVAASPAAVNAQGWWAGRAALRRGRDVLVVAEDVARIVLRLHLAEPVIAPAEVRADPVLVVARGEVDIPALLRVRREGFVVVPDPASVRLVPGGVGPHPR